MTGADHRADIARELLENAGIKVVVLDQHDRLFVTTGEFRLFVAEADEAKALQLLKDLKK